MFTFPSTAVSSTESSRPFSSPPFPGPFPPCRFPFARNPCRQYPLYPSLCFLFLVYLLLSIFTLPIPLSFPPPASPTCRIALEAFITCNEAETTGVILSGGVICLPGISLSLLLRNRQVLDHPTSTHVYRCLFGRKTQRKN